MYQGAWGIVIWNFTAILMLFIVTVLVGIIEKDEEEHYQQLRFWQDRYYKVMIERTDDLRTRGVRVDYCISDTENS
jgi:hypothetical protein